MQQNQQLRADLENLGVKQEDQIKNSISTLLHAKFATASRTGGDCHDKTEKYKSMPGVSPEDIKQLVDLDKNIERLFEIQMRKRNKNDEMIRNKINDLNEKPVLRDFLFKQVSDQQLKQDIEEIEYDCQQLYQIA